MRTFIFRKYRVQFLIKILFILSLLMHVLCTSRALEQTTDNTQHSQKTDIHAPGRI